MAKDSGEEEDRHKRKRATKQKLEETYVSGLIVKHKQKRNSVFKELSDSSCIEHNLDSQGLFQQGQQMLGDKEHFDPLYERNDRLEDCIGQVTSSTELPKKAMGNAAKKKKIKKKRDRWGQVLSEAGNMEDAAMEDDMVETAEFPSSGHKNGDSEVNHGLCEGHYDNKTVCAGGMPYDTPEADIFELFKECGAIANVICMKFADTQKFKGLAFITFKTEEAATKALSLDGTNMGGRLIKIEKAKAGGKVLRDPPKREPGSLSVYIGNLNWDIKKIDIKRFFKGCSIDDIRLAVNKHTGDFCGYGHVDFSDEKSLRMATKMDQKELLGRPVKVSYAVSKGSKERVTH
ncbi:hypothetical protein L7F22_037311 [Adiantum nelumboides]|nr:hypothetical protein [Adiantum nelumboides]